MSFVDLRSYFEARMSSVDPDLREWEDAFSIDNIPSTILDKAWHVRFGPFGYKGSAHLCLNFDCPVEIKVIFKGYRNPKEAVDIALRMANDIVKACTDPVQRLTQPNIKNVLPTSIDINDLGATNDNVVVLDLSFKCEVII